MNILHTYVVLAYKESEYLEECVKSVLNQNYKSNVVIATSTPNDYIQHVSKKYNLKLFINPNPGKGIGCDFDFAISCGTTDLVTVAHQDDIYEKNYSLDVVNSYISNKTSSILFSDYFEIRAGKIVDTNINLKIKRILLFPLRFKLLSKTRFGKRLSLRFGNAICCPAVTFVKTNLESNDIFSCDFKCDVDWYAWEKLSNQSGKFTFINKKLMGHRVHESSTTTEIINDNIRTREDLVMLNKFWPSFMAKFINRYYVKAENSNNTNKD